MATLADETRVRGFIQAPVLDNVDGDDQGLVSLISGIFLDSQRPRAICAQWAVDTYDHHYNIVFDLVPKVEVTDAHLQVLRDINVVRVQRVLVSCLEGHLRVTVQLAKSSENMLMSEEHMVRIITTTRRNERVSGGKRQRTGSPPAY
jgi:hypothetical protein